MAAFRARDLGIPFTGRTGRWNAITDVGGGTGMICSTGGGFDHHRFGDRRAVARSSMQAFGTPCRVWISAQRQHRWKWIG